MVDAIDIPSRIPEVRYIKLGKGNAWAERAIRAGEIPFSFREVPHELGLTQDDKAIAAHLIARSKSKGAATNAAGQICAFYNLDGDTIWITFANGLMWWTRADPEVTWLGESDDYAPRIRRSTGGWRSESLSGIKLYMSMLSSKLTKTASSQSTSCKVDAAGYVLRKIYGQAEPAVQQALAAKAGALEAIGGLIDALHWSDFETLADLLLARSGWHRVSSLGGNMKDADMIVEQAITGETAIVQVKSTSDQNELDRYIGIFDAGAGQWTRLIFVCHSPIGSLSSARPEIIVWTKSQLAELIFRQGLFDWLIARTS